jgi:hypothetical protein
VDEQLAALIKSRGEPGSMWALLTEVKRGEALDATGTDALRERILRLVLSKKEFEALYQSILELEAELDRLDKTSDNFRYSKLVQTLTDDLKNQRKALIDKAEKAARSELSVEHANLEQLLQNALRIRLEITAAEQRRLEAQLKPGKVTDEVITEYDFAREVAENQLYWPLGEEYWRDELGTYLYTLSEGCAELRATTSVPAER